MVAWLTLTVFTFLLFRWYAKLWFGTSDNSDKEIEFVSIPTSTDTKSTNHRRSPAAKARKKNRTTVPNTKGRGRKAPKGMSGRVIEWADGRRTVLR